MNRPRSSTRSRMAAAISSSCKTFPHSFSGLFVVKIIGRFRRCRSFTTWKLKVAATVLPPEAVIRMTLAPPSAWRAAAGSLASAGSCESSSSARSPLSNNLLMGLHPRGVAPLRWRGRRSCPRGLRAESALTASQLSRGGENRKVEVLLKMDGNPTNQALTDWTHSFATNYATSDSPLSLLSTDSSSLGMANCEAPHFTQTRICGNTQTIGLSRPPNPGKCMATSPLKLAWLSEPQVLQDIPIPPSCEIYSSYSSLQPPLQSKTNEKSLWYVWLACNESLPCR